MLEVCRTWLGRAVFGLLVAFHVWLFFAQVSDGRLFEAAVVLRWMIGAGLALGFLALRRVGAPIFWGRRAVGLWLLVVVLHCQAAVGPSAGEVARVTFAETVAVFVLQTTTGTTALAALGLALLTALGAGQRRPALAGSWLVRVPIWRAAMADGFVLPFSPRPPPRS